VRTVEKWARAAMADEWDEFDPDKLIEEKDAAEDEPVTEVVDLVAVAAAAAEADRLAGRGEGICPAAIESQALKAVLDTLIARLKQEEPRRMSTSEYSAVPLRMRGNILRLQPPGSWIKGTSKEVHIAIAADEYEEPRAALNELLQFAETRAKRLATEVGSVRDPTRDKAKSDLQNSLETALPRLAQALHAWNSRKLGDLASAVAELGAAQDVLFHLKDVLEGAAEADSIFALLARSGGARALCLMAAAEEMVELTNARVNRFVSEDDDGKESCKATKWSNVEARSATVRLPVASTATTSCLVVALKHVVEFEALEKALDLIYAGTPESSGDWENKNIALSPSACFEAPRGVNKAGRKGRHVHLAPYTNVPYNSDADASYEARMKMYRAKGWTDVSDSPLTAIGRVSRLLRVPDLVSALVAAAAKRGPGEAHSGAGADGGRSLANLLLAIVDLPSLPYMLIDAALWRPWSEAAPRRGVAGEVPATIDTLKTALGTDEGFNVLWFLAYHYYAKFLYRVDCYGGFRLGVHMDPGKRESKSALDSKSYIENGQQVYDEIQDGDYRHRKLAVTNARRVADVDVREALRKADATGAMWPLLLMYTITDRWLPISLEEPLCSPLARKNWVRCKVEGKKSEGGRLWPGGWRTSVSGNELGDAEFRWAFTDVPDAKFKGGRRTTIYTTPSTADAEEDLRKPLTDAASYLDVIGERAVRETEEVDELEFDDGDSISSRKSSGSAGAGARNDTPAAPFLGLSSSPWRKPRPKPRPWAESCETEIATPHPVLTLFTLPPSVDNWTASGKLPSNVCEAAPWYLYSVPFEDYHRFRNGVGLQSLRADVNEPDHHLLDGVAKRLVEEALFPPESLDGQHKALQSTIAKPRSIWVCKDRAAWSDVTKDSLAKSSKIGPAAANFYASLVVWDFLVAVFDMQLAKNLTAMRMRDEADAASDAYAVTRRSARGAGASGQTAIDLTSPMSVESSSEGWSTRKETELVEPFPSSVADTWGNPRTGPQLTDVLDVSLIRGWPVGGVSRVSFYGQAEADEEGTGAGAGSSSKRRRMEAQDGLERDGVALAASVSGSGGPAMLRAGDIVLLRPDDTVREEQVLVVSVEVNGSEVTLTLVRRDGLPHIYENLGGKNLMLRYDGQPNSVPVCVGGSYGGEDRINVKGWHVVPGTDAKAAAYRSALVGTLNAHRKSRLWLAALKWAWGGAQTDAFGRARSVDAISDMMGGQASDVVEAELTARLLAAPRAASLDAALRQHLAARLGWLKARSPPSVHEYHLKGWPESSKSQMHVVDEDAGAGAGAADASGPHAPLNLRGLRLELISAGGDDTLPTSSLLWPTANK